MGRILGDRRCRSQNGQLIASALKHHLGGMRWLIGVQEQLAVRFSSAGGHNWGLGDQVEWSISLRRRPTTIV
jgi:hypothetical protein